MEILLVIFAVGTFAGFAMAVRNANEKGAVERRLLESQSTTEDMRRELSDTRTALSGSKKTIGDRDKELASIKDDLKATRQKAHDRQKELESVQKELVTTREKHAALGTAGEMREQLMDALADKARLEREVARLKADQAAFADPAPTTSASAGEEVDTAALSERHRAELGDLRRRLRAQADELNRSFDEQVGKERDRARRELKDLRRRLSRALNEVERERRRADANDKAYFILKSQLESTLDRLAAVDPSLRRPDAMTPEEIAARLSQRVQQRVDAAQASAPPRTGDVGAGESRSVAIAEPDEPADTTAEPDESAEETAPAEATAPAEEPAPAEETAEAPDAGTSADTAPSPTADDDSDDDDARPTAAPLPAEDEERTRPAAPRLTPAPVPALSASADEDDDDGWDVDDEELARVSGSFAAVPDPDKGDDKA